MCLSHLVLVESKCVTCDTLIVTKTLFWVTSYLPWDTFNGSCVEQCLVLLQVWKYTWRIIYWGKTWKNWSIPQFDWCDRSDRSRLANCKSEMMESRSSQICHQGVNASSSISGGHVLQAVRNSSTISFHNLFMCFVTKLWSDLLQFINMNIVHQKKF